MAINIYFADLVYKTNKTNFFVPLNIGYVAAFLKERFREDVNIKLFKYPDVLEKALVENPPDILALSYYNWNARLSLLFLDMVKRLNSKTLTVMGGPNIRTDPDSLKKFFASHTNLDYYITNDGPEPFSKLIGEILAGRPNPDPLSLAAEPFDAKSMEINHPSPYLTGLLDEFLADPDINILLETNRGCPFRCAYCAWGGMLPKIRTRPLEQVLKEIEYIAEKSASQPTWIFCDSNFGILPRDLEIAKKVREVMDKKGYPKDVIIWQSKNTPARNIKIGELLGKNNRVLIAIQSADPKVLDIIGRGNIKMSSIKEEVDYYHKKNLKLGTDILVGLPGESKDSHCNTLAAAFDMGFDYIAPLNIMLLQGTRYESDEYRQKYGVKTKYRPIFGAYGTYDNKKVFEIEESVRATKDMPEQEMNNLKIHHWLIFLTWNYGVFKPILMLGKKQGINPETVIKELSQTQNPVLKDFFDRFKKQSMEEWFKTKEEMISFYERPENFSNLVKGFVKLNLFYVAWAFQNPEVLNALKKEMEAIVVEKLKENNVFDLTIIKGVAELSDLFVCKNFLEGERQITVKYPGQVVSVAIDDAKFADKDTVELEIYRPQEFVELCRAHLCPDGKENLSLENIAKFLEIGGASTLKNKVIVKNL